MSHDKINIGKEIVMKILFLHLTDIHIFDNECIIEICPHALAISLREVGRFDACCIIVSGDVAFSGQRNQYEIAQKLFDSINTEINSISHLNYAIRILVVPGNHDNVIKNTERTNRMIVDGFHREGDKYFRRELSQLDNFYKFSDKYECFQFGNRIINIKRVVFGNVAIKANLINSAPFSLLGNAYDDKGLHHLPKKEILKLENTNSKQDMEITIIHHSPEWFDDPTKKDLYRIIPQYSDMVFTGHEHYKASGEFSLNQSSSILVSQSKALYGTAEEEGYSCFLFDSNSRKIYEYEFVRKNQKYNLTNQTEERISPKNEFGFSFRKEFSGSLEKDSGLYLDKNYLEYFVFPGLRIVAEKREPDITNIESFKRVIESIDP